MKKLAVVLAGLLTLPAFAEVAPAYYYNDIAEYEVPADVEAVDEIVESDAIESDTAATTNAPRATSTTRRATTTRGATRPGAVGTSARVTTRRDSASNTTTRGTTARATTTRAATATRTATQNVTNRTTATRGTTARAGTTNATRRASTRAPIAARAGSLVQTDTVNTPLYTGRVGVRRTAMSAGSRATGIRASSSGFSAADLPTSVSVAETPISATIDVDTIAQQTDFCRAQYTACMDNYCNVLDDNQGRCSCSANLKNYEKTELALKQATEDLQEVSQKIQYIGLDAEDIETLFTQTEAEAQLQATTDNTQLKNDLDKIKKLIVDVKTGNATSTETGVSMDLSGLLDFNINGSGFDLGSLFGNNSANTNSISNQRGEQLYKTAAARCKASVLKTCEAQGVDISVITNGYDLEIDKQCLVYERSLSDANDQMSSTVRNAKNVLQRARLMVAQQRNSLDLRGCVTELDACMQNEFVCGDDYENCLDPSGRYIINGEIVIGGAPGVSGGDLSALTEGNGVDKDTHPLYATWNYGQSESTVDNNAWGPYGTVAEYVDAKKQSSEKNLIAATTDMATFLQSKIGYHDDNDDINHGMCMSVLNKCQNYTYDKSGKYQFDNVVIREYLNRTLATIKNAQDQLLADHAEECMSDVSSCLTQNKYETASKTAISACKPQIVTCMSVNGSVNIDYEMSTWVSGVMANKDANSTTTTTTYIPQGVEYHCVKLNTATIASAAAAREFIEDNKEKYVAYTLDYLVPGQSTVTNEKTALPTYATEYTVCAAFGSGEAARALQATLNPEDKDTLPLYIGTVKK